MLEYPALLLRPAGSDGMRPIVGPSGTPLGFARMAKAKGIRRWLGWQEIEVHEEEDSPLLFTIRRRWTWPARFEVCDAEDYLVGSLAGRFLLNEFNRRLAEKRFLSSER